MFTITKTGKLYVVKSGAWIVLKDGEHLMLEKVFKSAFEAEKFAKISSNNLHDLADFENARFDAVKAYIAKRAARPASTQLTLF